MLKGSDRVTAAGRQTYRTSRCGKQMAVTIWSYTGTSGGGQGGLGSGVPPPALVLQWCNTGGENRYKRMNERSCSAPQAGSRSEATSTPGSAVRLLSASERAFSCENGKHVFTETLADRYFSGQIWSSHCFHPHELWSICSRRDLLTTLMSCVSWAGAAPGPGSLAP